MSNGSYAWRTMRRRCRTSTERFESMRRSIRESRLPAGRRTGTYAQPRTRPSHSPPASSSPCSTMTTCCRNSALYEIAVELNAHPDADVVYSDSDCVDDSGRRLAPDRKTDWEPDLMLGHNMVSHLGGSVGSLVEKLGGMRLDDQGSQDYDLMLRAAENTTPDRIRHVPAVLYHWRRNAVAPSFSESSLDLCVVAARRAIRTHLQRTGTIARVEPAPLAPAFNRIVYPVPGEPPLVSVIVPTRDRADLLARCADGVLTRTDYEPLELIIVDNASSEPATLELLSRLQTHPRVRLIRYEGAFNFAAMNNRAVLEARGSVVVLLNNDVDVLSPVWLEEMVSHARSPGRGGGGSEAPLPRRARAACRRGARRRARRRTLLPSGCPVTISATTVFSCSPGGCRPSPQRAWQCVVRRISRSAGSTKSTFPSPSTMSTSASASARAGYAIVWTPHAVLQHFESATRGSDLKGEQAARLGRDGRHLRDRWGPILDNDRSLQSELFLLGSFRAGVPAASAQAVAVGRYPIILP